MGKKIKFTDNTYLDSSGIMHGDNTLDEELADVLSKIIKNWGDWGGNGHYIKFTNGMGVCFGTTQVTNINTTEENKIGALYWIDNFDVELPIHFKDLNYQCIVFQKGNAMCFPYGVTNKETDFISVHFASPNTRTSSNVTISYIAWGYTKT